MSATIGQDSNAVVFLGMADHAVSVEDGAANLRKWNVLGLRNVILSCVYPMPLRGAALGIAVRAAVDPLDFRLHLVDPSGARAASICLSLLALPASDVAQLPVPLRVADLPVLPAVGWTPLFLPLGQDSPIVVVSPGRYSVTLEAEGEDQPIGELAFEVWDPPALTDDRIAAIRSDVHAGKWVRMGLQCSVCKEECRAYAGIERSAADEAEGWIWYRDLPAVFECGCGEMRMDLSTIRRNLHGLLGQPRQGEDGISLVPLYEQGMLEATLKGFDAVLHSATTEEDLQVFIQEHPVLLHQFPAERLLFKPDILNRYKADFAIVTPQRELVLVELEKPNTLLMKKDGGVAASLTHAFDQVRSWIHLADEYRLAVLEALHIEKQEVSSVKGVVIAGRDAGYDSQHLRALKCADWGRIQLLTYDDMSFALSALIRGMHVS